MRIGVLTFHNAYNYGAILQAYATQKLIEDLGHNVEIIDYRNKEIESSYIKRTSFSSQIKGKYFNLKWVLIIFIISIFNYKRENVFNVFIKKHLHISHKKYNIEKPVINDYDIILIGSDQVWFPKLTGGLDRFYWGNFTKTARTKIIAWAASVRDISFTKSEMEQIQKYLLNFSAISVREESLRAYISGLTNINVTTILDPTLLLSDKRWLSLYKPVKEKHYVLIYAVNYETNSISLGKQLAKGEGLDYIVITPIANAKINKHYKQYKDPASFISYINDADYIVLCSFHALAFSLLLQKQFFAFVQNDTNNIRIESLLHKLGLEDRIISDDFSFTNIDQIDYKVVGSKLETLKTESMEFVNEILK